MSKFNVKGSTFIENSKIKALFLIEDLSVLEETAEKYMITEYN